MFFGNLAIHGNKPAVIDQQHRIDYLSLQQRVDTLKKRLPDSRSLVLLSAKNNLNTLVAYLACLQLGHCVLLVPETVDSDKQTSLAEQFDVNHIIDDLVVSERHRNTLNRLEGVALMLPTSGSTGAAKQVALSAQNLDANARSICDYLPILPSDKAIINLPFYYSYGLSIINSHLNMGACLVFTPYTVVNREFWSLMNEEHITSLAGVPHSYQMMLRLKLTNMDLPSLRYLTQAGGKLPSEQVEQIASWAQDSGKQFFVMYGQTEATARMAYLSFEKTLTKSASIGKAIPGGEFRLIDADGTVIETSDKTGELHYKGKNVMLGYVSGGECELEEQPGEWLATGDLAYRDDDGDFFIVGRKKRFIKLFGERVSLDVVENILGEQGIESYCCGTDNKLVVGVEAQHDSAEVRTRIARQLNVHPSVVTVLELKEFPVNANGKRDYQKLMQLAEVSA